MDHGIEVAMLLSAASASFIDLNPAIVISLIVLGFFGGVLSGFIGSGGAFVLTPGMMSMGVEGLTAVASNMAHKFPKAIVGAWKRRKMGHVDLRLALLMMIPAIVGVLLGAQVQLLIKEAWGSAGSNLYISVVFVAVLSTIGTYTLQDGRKAARQGIDDTTSALAEKVKKLNIWPMITFKEANSRVSLWVTLPFGFATGFLAATIAVGGFIGVPSMIYVIGAPSFVASGTELMLAFGMGFVGTLKYATGGLVDFRLTALLLAGSLVGVQLGAIGTSYVRQYMIKIVAGSVMILAGVSRAIAIPTYLTDLDVVTLGSGTYLALGKVSLIFLFATLIGSGLLIIGAMYKGRKAALASARTAVQAR